jgi:endonuclease/exonuclease/phosphatase (EEP) superfamily protein YafD
MSIKVCTYNMGSNLNDYCLLHEYRDPTFQIQNEEQHKKLQEDYQQAQISAANNIQELADVFCLQEAVEEARPLIKNLRSRGFTLYTIDRPYFDCAILLSPQFTSPHNHSKMLEGGDVALVTATHQPTGEKCTFVSAHSPGFKLEGSIDKDDASYGDKYCKQIAEILDKLGTESLQIIGADMNAFPEIWPHRFEAFKTKQFEILRTGSPTNVMPKSTSHKTREIDYFFFKNNTSRGGFLSLFDKKPSRKGAIIPQSSITWDPLKNGSDHLPIIAHLVS